MKLTFKQYLSEVKYYKDVDKRPCPECNGKGMLRVPYMGEMEWDTCDDCEGDGQMTNQEYHSWLNKFGPIDDD